MITSPDPRVINFHIIDLDLSFLLTRERILFNRDSLEVILFNRDRGMAHEMADQENGK